MVTRDRHRQNLNKMTGVLDPFAPAVREWFAEAYEGPTRAQSLAWPEIQAGHSTLLCAPTGSGKTLAAFLAAIDRLMFQPAPAKASRCRVVYVSPLRALAVDVEKNLRVPLAGIAATAERRGDAFHVPAVAIRTGDTPAADRARLARAPADILITTPESLFLVLTSKARDMLRSVEVVIVDEIHALVATKRGAHLALSLERLAEVAGRPLQRIGLSATQRPLEEVARFLGGGEGVRTWKPRPVRIVDAGVRKAFDLKVEVPVEDMSNPGDKRSIWPAIHPRLLELVRGHKSTLVFVNNRRLAERLARALNELAGEDVARAHHGSVARDQRVEMEDQLKAGTLPCMVATSSLELGIDMGAIDLVIQIETPPSVASGIQRIGRASHQVEGISRGILFPKFRGDLLATAAITKAMQDGAVEETRIPENPLDVLAQQVAAACALDTRQADDLYALARRAAPFARLSRTLFDGVLDMLSGRYPSDEFAELRPRLTWDRSRGAVRGREGLQHLVVTNAGTIPDKGLYGVFLAESGAKDAKGRARPGRRVGELDEEMVFESREGEVFVLGASSWRIAEITRDRVLVEPAPGEPGKAPFWKADRGARPVALGRAIGRLARELLEAKRTDALGRLTRDHALDRPAAENLVAYLEAQRAATGSLPDDRTLVLERTRDEMGDWRLCLLSPFGGRVHAPLALAIEARLRATGEAEAETVWGDDGIVLRISDRERPPDLPALVPAPEEVEDVVMSELGGSPLFAARFREAAARALLLPRRRPGQRSPLWMQRKRSADLLHVAARYGSFPILLEAYRECLKDVFDVPALRELVAEVRARKVRLVTVDTQSPSPFAASLLFGYVANYLYEGDAPLAERRAQALSVDQAQLRDLLGETAMRDLLDPVALADLEESLQGRSATSRARNADRLHDLLLRVGDLSLPEIAERAFADEATARSWTLGLVGEGRVIPVRIAGAARFAAVEDAGRLRDALGVALPPGLPAAFLEPAKDALAGLLARYARTHGPFAAKGPAHRLGLDEAVVEKALEALAALGRIVRGEFRPGGHGPEWCAPDVLTSLRRRSLARLRREAEPAPPEALCRLLVDWHGLAASSPARQGPDGLLEVIEQLQGASFPASALETDILPARVAGYRPEHLDVLCSSGEVLLVGVSPLGERDGRVSVFLADDLWLLSGPPATPPSQEIHLRLREHLARHGASFFAELFEASGEALPAAAHSGLWDLFFAGFVTNDSPGALRAFLGSRTTRAALRRHRLSGAFRSRREAPASAGGRWSLLVPPKGPKAPTPTARAAALATQLLARHGVLTRDAALAEDVPGGFPVVYPVLRAMEEAGRVRRGYFVEGRGGSQFADPGALERLRALREPDPGDGGGSGVVLASTDPANPYGAGLPWPDGEGVRKARAAGTHVALVEGRLVGYIARDEKDLVTFLPPDDPERSRLARALCAALARWASRTGRSALGWSRADGIPLGASPLAPFLVEAGFERSGPGFRLGRRPD